MTQKELQILRDLFVEKMVVDSETKDRRRRDYNQAIFMYNDDCTRTCPVYSNTDMDMVLQCFDNAVKEFVRGE